MMSQNHPLTLTIQGITVPKLGLGTYTMTGSLCTKAVVHALHLGYRHIDTARIYQNEAAIGRGLRESHVPREEIFLTTKVWMNDYAPGRLRRAAEDTLRRLGTEYVNLLLLHWPLLSQPLHKTFEAMMKLREEGKIRHLGVSNFSPELLQETLMRVPLFCNQVEYHPYLAQKKQLALARKHDLLLTAYAPLAVGRVADDPLLLKIGRRHGKTPGQVVLRWLLDQPQVAVIPKAASPQNRISNFQVFDFSLSETESQRIEGLARDLRIYHLVENKADWEQEENMDQHQHFGPRD